jgi:hypothetical protein
MGMESKSILFNKGTEKRVELVCKHLRHSISFSDYVRFCVEEELLCRPKPDTVAVMFLKDDDFFWTRLTKREFYLIFGKEVAPN